MRSILVACALTSQLVTARFFWPDITHIFSFGDSYTDTIARFDFSTHALSAPNDAATTAGGRMWIEFLAQTYNVTADLKLFNFAYGGAVTDSSLIAQSSSATQSFKDQVNNFLLLQSTPAAQGWNSSNALFLSFFGINDVGKSFWWTNATREETNARVIASYFERLAILRDAGARNFLLLQVPDISRTPNLIRQGAPNATLQSSMSENYNTQLARAVQVFQRNSTRVGKVVDVKIHPTRELFAQSSSATQSLKDQVNNFLLLQSTPAAQGWNSSNALFLSFFGINDVGKSFWWTNATREETNARVIASYFERLAILRDAGARNFLLLQVPDISRTPNLIRQGAPNATLQSSMSENYNAQLARAVQLFQRNSTRVGKVVDVKIHPTRELFNFALDNAGVLGFENVTAGWWTGLAPEQQSGVSLATYFWWNNFHPTWGVHDLLGHSVSTFLSRWSGL